MYRCNGVIPELWGTKVRLRKLTMFDAEDLFQCWSDQQTSKYLFLPPMANKQDAQALIMLLNELAVGNDSLRWGIELQESGILIGSCGFNGWQFQGAYRGEFGCELASPYWGKGYMQEAATLAIQYGFQEMGLNRIEVLSDIRNGRAGVFFRNLGFQHEGLLREYRHTGTSYVDVNVFSLLRREF